MIITTERAGSCNKQGQYISVGHGLQIRLLKNELPGYLVFASVARITEGQNSPAKQVLQFRIYIRIGIACGTASSITSGMLSSMTIPTLDEINAMTGQQRKVLENRLRRAAARQGLRLDKSRARDPYSLSYGTYMLVDAQTNGVVCMGLPDGYGLDLEGVARHLFER